MAYTSSKSPVTYYGGKTSIINHVLEVVPDHSCYVEEFCGGAELLFAKPPVKNETINDKLDIVVNFYEVFKLHYRKLKPLIDASLISRTIHNRANNIIRAHKYGVEIDRVQLAWAFWLATNFSHMHKLGGGYKQERGGGRSTAKELQRKKEAFTEALAQRIENVTIEN